MPAIVHHPTAVALNEGPWVAIGGTVVSAVQSNDERTSYVAISFANPAKQLRYTMPDLPSTAATVQSVVEAGYFERDQAVGSTEGAFLLNGSSYGGSFTPPVDVTTFFDDSWTSNLTVAGVNGAESGILGFDTAGAGIYCTELYRTTTYSDGGELIVVLFNLLLPVVGVGLTLAQLSAFNAQVAKPAGHWLKSSELAQAHVEWTAQKRPAFCFLNGGVA